MVLHVILVKESGMYLSQIHMLATSFVGMILVFICLHLTSVKFQKKQKQKQKNALNLVLEELQSRCSGFHSFSVGFLSPQPWVPTLPRSLPAVFL